MKCKAFGIDGNIALNKYYSTIEAACPMLVKYLRQCFSILMHNGTSLTSLINAINPEVHISSNGNKYHTTYSYRHADNEEKAQIIHKLENKVQ